MAKTSVKYNPAELETRRTEAFEKAADALARIADAIDNWKVKKDDRHNSGS